MEKEEEKEEEEEEEEEDPALLKPSSFSSLFTLARYQVITRELRTHASPSKPPCAHSGLCEETLLLTGSISTRTRRCAMVTERETHRSMFS
ncbi:hypothetical protein ElyMa_004485100 [Elysia marginata]|uniref:Uncharacterized protein n=1 Tax=Elysia marginata TaxID=1093978 RepID=A0AAV4HJE1_9GAST|nr:hypothetical protein ElyMa_004485100 [Elysia marginata]